MKTLAIATAAALTLTAAAPAVANDQLAASLGVDGDTFTTAQLVELRNAIADDNTYQVNQILKSATQSVDASTKSVGGAATDQLAKSLGVDAADYSRAELVALKAALDDDDAARVNAILKHAASKGSHTTEAWIQLGKSVGLDATTASPAEIVNAHKS